MGTKITTNENSLINYDSWNQVLCEHFFGKNNENNIVYLYVNENLVKRLGYKLGLNENQAMPSFCKSVRSYGRNEPDMVFDKAFIWGRKWYNQGQIGFPPFIGVLALTVLAATKMKGNRKIGIGAGNYYLRLRNLLELNGEGKPLYFEKTKTLWFYLTQWQKENKGRFGFTNVFRYGQAYIGYPMSQCLIKDADRQILYEFFYWAGLRPGLKVQANAIKEQLELFLSTKVNRLSRLFFNKNKGIQEGIIQALLFEYQNWNGTNNNVEPQGSLVEKHEKNKPKKYNLFLRIDEDKQSNFFNPKLKLGFFAIVDEDTVLEESIEKKELEGFMYNNNTFYKEVNSNQNHIIADKHSYSLFNSQLEFVFKGGNLFFFNRGTDIGINAWINRESVVKGKDHLVLFSSEVEKEIRSWVDLNGFLNKEISISNLSSFWKCLIIKIHEKEIIGSQFLENHFVFTQAQDKISLKDGLKVGNMEWLLDAPPQVSIVTSPKTTIYINDVPVFSLIDGEDTINFRNLHLIESKIYKIRFNDTEKTILLKNNHENLITFSDFKPKEYSDGNLKIAGTYIYDSLEDYPRPYKQRGYKAFLSTKDTNTTKVIPKFINAMPFNINRSYKDIGVTFSGNVTTVVRPIDLFFEYLTIRKEGNWESFLKGVKWCFGSQNIGLTSYKVRQKLSQLGFVEFIRDGDSNKYFWNVIPMSIAVMPSNDPLVYLTGGRTRESIDQLKNLTEGKIKLLQAIPLSQYEPLSIYLLGSTVESLKEFFNTLSINFNWGLDYFSYDLLRCLPTLNDYISNAREYPEPRGTNTYWVVKGWDLFSHSWIKDKDSPLKIYANSFGQYICLYKTSNNKTIKLERAIGKLYLAQQQRQRSLQYKNYELKVKQGYELPELYERVLTSCVGQCPIESNGYRVYRNVPHEVALSLAYKLGIEINYNK
ncbi:hypothetical protein E1I69_13485 [Bacillus timonensis]|uniref:Uncharacterized protein n=1 Tax=Bacillus timonensis TaxID=1033734 RepID=A0A4S3PQK0_9BACI|nr:hypothetical protein [Bacillus timonensis]THE11889.1 hypothetical protein E1I69_13485 [Bacillus timonensis]